MEVADGAVALSPVTGSVCIRLDGFGCIFVGKRIYFSYNFAIDASRGKTSAFCCLLTQFFVL